MKTKFGFFAIKLHELESWIKLKKTGRTVTKVQIHHTYIPDYRNFKGTNHFELQQAMKNHHMNSNGWGGYWTAFHSLS